MVVRVLDLNLVKLALDKVSQRHFKMHRGLFNTPDGETF